MEDKAAVLLVEDDASMRDLIILALGQRMNLQIVSAGDGIEALGYEEVIQQAVEAGASDFIVKPFDIEDLVRRTQQALGESVADNPQISPVYHTVGNHPTNGHIGTEWRSRDSATSPPVYFI